MANDDGIIRIGTQVDISGLQSGMQQAADVAESSSQAMAEAMGAASAAAQGLAEAQADLGAAAESSGGQAAALATTYQQAGQQAAAVAQQFSRAMGPLTQIEAAYQDLAAATAQAAVSQANLRTAIASVVDGTTPYAAATDALTVALREQYEASQALKTAKLGLAEASEAAAAGTAEEAAAEEEAAAATSALASVESEEASVVRSGLSARMAANAELMVLQGNIYGSTRAASAFLTVIPGVGEALQGAFAVFGAVALASVIVDLGQKMYTAFDLGGQRARKTQQDIAAVTGEINRSTTSLDVQIDKLQQEQAKLEHQPFNGIKLDLDEAAESAQRLSGQLDQIVEKEKAVIAGMSASLPQRLLGQSQTGYEQTMLEQHAKWISQAKTQQDQLNESISYGNSLQIRLNDLKQRQAQANAAAAGSGGETGIVADYSREIQAVQQMIGWQQQEQANIKATIALNHEQARTTQVRTTSSAATLQHREQSQQIAADRASDALIDRETREEIKAYQELDRLKRQASEHNNFSAEVSGIAQQTDALKEQEDQYIKLNQAAVEATEIQQRNANALTEASIGARAASHAITPLAEAQAIAALHAREYAQQLAALNAQLQVQQQLGKDGAAAQTQNQILQLQGANQVTGVQDAAAIQQQIAQPYNQAFQTINQSWIQTQNKLLVGTRSVGLAFAEMGQQILISAIDNFEKMALKWAETQIQMTIANSVAKETQVATNAAAAAQTNAISAASSFQQAKHNAGVVFGDVYKALAGIPIIGPVIAPIAATTAAGAVLAMAAFETGTGYIPRDGVAMLHEGEAVIPAPTMEELRGAPGGNSVNITQNNHFTGSADKEFLRQLDKYSSHVASTVQKHYRRAGRM